MSLTAQAAAAAAAAFNSAGDAKTTIALYLGATSTYNPALDTATLTWEQSSTGLSAIAYADKNERRALGPETRQRTFMVLGSQVTAGAPGQAGEIVEGSTTWKIYSITTDPTNAIWIFHCKA